jgi:hypothetical protein
MSKNTEKWDRSGFNELIREDKQKINDFKKTEIYKTNKELRLNENTSTIKYNEPINNNFQNSKQQTPITKTSDFKDENKSNKQFYNNYNNFKQKRRKNNVIETSKERKVTEKAKQDKIKVNDTILLDLLQPEFSKLQTETLKVQNEQVILYNQMRRRASSISKTYVNSPQTSKNNSPQTQSICPICHKSSIYETVVMWKECKHTMVSVPYLSL